MGVLKKMWKNKKAMTLGQAPNMILAFGLTVLIAGAVALALSGFKDTTTTNTYAYNITEDGESGLNNFSGQVPTVGTILGVSLIIVIVVGAFAYVGFRQGGM